MDVIFSQLKQKDVINLADGKHLGKICDINFTFPEGKIIGFSSTGCKGFKFSRQEIFLPLNSVVKIGEDAVLVKYGKEEKEKGCPPQKEPPPCPPQNDRNCSPPCPPNFCPPERRSLDEYE